MKYNFETAKSNFIIVLLVASSQILLLINKRLFKINKKCRSTVLVLEV